VYDSELQGQKAMFADADSLTVLVSTIERASSTHPENLSIHQIKLLCDAARIAYLDMALTHIKEQACPTKKD